MEKLKQESERKPKRLRQKQTKINILISHIFLTACDRAREYGRREGEQKRGRGGWKGKSK